MKNFYKIMPPGFMTELNLPLNFCKSAKEEFSPISEVRSCLGIWKIKVGKLRSEERFYLYGSGWSRFVMTHELRQCECVVFEHRGSFRFYATIYLPSGSLKNFSQPFTNVDHRNVPHQKSVDHGNVSHQKSVDHTFTRTLSAHSGGDFHNRNTSRLYLPTKIWKYNNDFVEKRKAILQMSGLNTIWLANLMHYPGESYDRFAVADGWYDFALQNDVNKGHYCKFEIMVDASPLGYSKKTIIITVTKLN